MNNNQIENDKFILKFEFNEKSQRFNNIEYIEKKPDKGNFKTKDTYILKHKELSKIKDFIYESLNKFTTELWNSKQKVVLTQSWCNKNPTNTDHPIHFHANSIISGVFYFKQNPTLPPIQFSRIGGNFYAPKVEKYNIFNSDILLFPMVDG